MLGSSTFSARLAAMLGLPFAFARHFAPQQTLPALATYREGFRPGGPDDQSALGALERPYAMLTVTVVAADTDAEAERVAAPARLSMARLRTGSPGRLPTFEEAAATPLTDLQRSAIAPSSSAWITGSRDSVRDQLAELIATTQPDELMISGMIPGLRERVRSLELIAEAVAALPVS
ncbi:LLM class flavin-dependent oxidoreductase [Tsukamurella soli]|uniref:LLM class flavin-dependent oxidoreductase n=1 Tax=Tsukamurella soli TaxID=644556 RepID=UPI003620D244